MAVHLVRGNIPARILPNTTATIAVTLDVSDLIAEVSGGRMTTARARAEAVQRAAAELQQAAAVADRTDEQIDADVAAMTAHAARIKALRPTGGL